MRRISRVDRSIDLLRKRAIKSSPQLCSACHQASPFSTTNFRAARTNDRVPITEKVRQRIWGTDKPPGLEDPYGDGSILDKTKKQPQQDEIVDEFPVEEQAVTNGVEPDMSTYEAATTWDGLEKVGGFGKWWQQNWDPDHKFKGFLPAERVTHLEDITAALHRALVEVFALQQAGRSIAEIANASPGADVTTEVQIVPTKSGASLQFTGAASLDQIIQSLAPVIDETAVKTNPTEAEEDVAADRSTVDPLAQEDSIPEDETALKSNPTESEEDVAADRSEVDPLESTRENYEAAIESWGSEWYSASLEDLEVKFAVIKRVLQLTGIRVPDHAIQSSKTAHTLLSHMATPPKARKVVDFLSAREDLITLPNVSVYAKRITPIDKERAVGRWKIIEEELEKRGLPVTGR
ncbi:hypothetical protein PVAG01_03465 [Phlyctema vagabunda]|uniref:Large ribosomal subunit protein mL50 n=1 Tax=Phlyctema vagabunda TaxID=108571 RepID=A0ABR4PLK7_9HELO